MSFLASVEECLSDGNCPDHLFQKSLKHLLLEGTQPVVVTLVLVHP